MAEDRLEANKLSIERNTPRKLTWGNRSTQEQNKTQPWRQFRRQGGSGNAATGGQSHPHPNRSRIRGDPTFFHTYGEQGVVNHSLFAKKVWGPGARVDPSKSGMYECQMREMYVL